MKKLKAWRGLGNPGARIYSLSLHLESWGRLITPPDFYLHTHWADFRLYKLGIRGQSNEIICKQGIVLWFVETDNGVLQVFHRINWKKNVIYYSIRKWTRTHENVPVGPDSMSLHLKKTNAMELIEQGIPRIEMSQTCTQKSKCGALTERLKRNGNWETSKWAHCF